MTFLPLAFLRPLCLLAFVPSGPCTFWPLCFLAFAPSGLLCPLAFVLIFWSWLYYDLLVLALCCFMGGLQSICIGYAYFPFHDFQCEAIFISLGRVSFSGERICA
jgi:hypothetical protein